MTKLLEFEEDGVLVAVPTPGDEIEAVGRLDETIERIDKSVAEVFDMVGKVARDFYGTLKTAPVETAEVELGLQVTGKGRLYVVESEAQAAIKVKLTLKPQQGVTTATG
jgi:tetrahydromethanopterin S-methyltransferase subunit G